MKKMIGILLLLMAQFAMPAKSQEVLYSSYEKFDLQSGDFSIIGKVGSRLYTYRTSSDGFYLDAWNDSMSRLATIMLDFFPKRIYETRFIAYASQMIVLYQSIEGTKVTQYAALLDETGRLVKGPLTLTSARTGIFGPNRDYFSSAVSDDKKWIMVYGFEDKRNEFSGTAIWLNDSLRITDRGTATLKEGRDLTYGEPILADDGTFYMPAYSLLGSRGFADEAWMISLQRGSRIFNAIPLSLNENFVNGLFLKQDNPNNRIYLCGFFSNKRGGNAEGIVYSRFDLKSETWETPKFLAFSDQLRNSTGERSKKRALNDYVIRNLIVRKDGGFALLAEDYYITIRNNYTSGWGGYYSFYNGPFMTQSLREYHYEDVLAISYNEAGATDWFAFVRKSQYSQEDGGVFSSYGLLNTGGALGLIFNDFNTSHSRIELATIDGTGKVEMRSFSPLTGDDPDWLPRSGKQIAAREMVVPCLRKKQLCFAKIVF